MADPHIDAAFHAFATERRFRPATVERWSHLQEQDAAALLALMQELRPSENQLRDLWKWIEEIAARDQSSLASVLASEPLTATRRRNVSRNDRLKLVKGALRRQRFPQLAATEDRLAGFVRELGLPRNVRVTLPEFLEGDAIQVAITASSPAALRAAADALQAAAASAACAALFAGLDEAM
jgi:ribonuclease D